MNCDTYPASVILVNRLGIRDSDRGVASEDSRIGSPRAFFLPWKHWFNNNIGSFPFIQKSVKVSCTPSKHKSSDIKASRKIRVPFLSSTLAQCHTIGHTKQTKNWTIILHYTSKSAQNGWPKCKSWNYETPRRKLLGEEKIFMTLVVAIVSQIWHQKYR